MTSCLVNPRACHETLIKWGPATDTKNIAVVGAGPAGMSAALTAAESGHTVTLYEGSAELGGQFNLAKRIPGKEDFDETIRYFKTRLTEEGVNIQMMTRPAAAEFVYAAVKRTILCLYSYVF